MEERLEQGAKTALLNCLDIKPGEKVLIVTDTRLKDLAEVFFQEALTVGAEALLMEMRPRSSNGEEPPKPVAAAMEKSAAVLLITEKSLSHTQARKKANRAGARVASLPGLTKEMMMGPLNADYQRIGALSEKISAILTRGQKARLTSKGGTDLSFDLTGRRGQPDGGIYHQPGIFGNLPAGEAYIAPLEGQSQGVLVVDGSMAGIGMVQEAITIQVVGGYAREISGGPEADKLLDLIRPHGQKGRNIAELGIGTNHAARLTGATLEDEKILGTVHVALGDNHTIGGVVEVASHLDGVILAPTLEVDGEFLLKDGKLVAEF